MEGKRPPASFLPRRAPLKRVRGARSRCWRGRRSCRLAREARRGRPGPPPWLLPGRAPPDPAGPATPRVRPPRAASTPSARRPALAGRRSLAIPPSVVGPVGRAACSLSIDRRAGPPARKRPAPRAILPGGRPRPRRPRPRAAATPAGRRRRPGGPVGQAAASSVCLRREGARYPHSRRLSSPAAGDAGDAKTATWGRGERGGDVIR
jgi:hypothetical protein